MPTPPYIIALDQGTTSSRAVVFDSTGGLVGMRSKEFTQYYPQTGWVEHDPWEIWHSQLESLRGVVRDCQIPIQDIAAIGITNQRETVLMWDRATRQPVYNAIVWQCRRTANFCEQLKHQGHEALIRAKTGLPVDAYFSAGKIRWLLDHADVSGKELCCGTVDSWLLYLLTGEKVHATDVTNAARTQLYNIYDNQWDDELLTLFGIPGGILPQVRPSGSVFGYLDKAILGREIPITAILGDQHAALFGQGCTRPGMAKNTYGTGCFLLKYTGAPVQSQHQLLTTLAWQVEGQAPEYALEGSIFMGGATIQWCRDELQLITHAADSEALACSLPDNGGVYLVPAFTGLGAPHWDMYARGTLLGMTRGTGKAHIVRAALEAIAFQTQDVLRAMTQDSGALAQLQVDGGASANDFLMQFQADLLNTPVCRPQITETTAQGVAWMAGLTSGLWDQSALRNLWAEGRTFLPQQDDSWRQRMTRDWQRAVQRTMHWLDVCDHTAQIET